jgi:hypothetical protein
MPDPYSGALGTTKQELTILARGEEAKKSKAKSKAPQRNTRGGDSENTNPSIGSATLYSKGLAAIQASGYVLELSEDGQHIYHRVLKPKQPPEVKGIKVPHTFNPLQDVVDSQDLNRISVALAAEVVGNEVRQFWTPFFSPKTGESDLHAFAKLQLQMNKTKNTLVMHEPMDYGHTFDPMGRIKGGFVSNPRVWVPDREWFDPILHNVQFSDVFTIFPPAEQQLLKLLLGRIGVGRTNHLPPTWDTPVDHTARMAAVIVGKDPGLGKSTLFNGLVAALSKCGFTTNTFRTTDAQFGMRDSATADICYKDDTSLPSLRKFLMSEETKTLITNGLFHVEDKYMKPEQIWPKTVMIVNANEWNSKFAYDLDPGIIDRIKLISTYRENEVKKLLSKIEGVSKGSPDLRPRSHIPWLAEKLGVSVDALYLWCLRLATDYFWEVITDNSDPSVNRLQVEVRKWTSRQRIRFKADVIQALVNAMAFSHAIRTKAEGYFMPELTPYVLYDYLKSFYFVGVDPSCLDLMTKMKEDWEKAGRPSSHYYQGFREIRWESVKKSLDEIKGVLFDEVTGKKQLGQAKTAAHVIKEMIEQLMVRDGFKLGGDANYVIEHWANTRYAQDELVEEAAKMLQHMSTHDRTRLQDLKARYEDGWMQNPLYSPDTAEKFRLAARTEMYRKAGLEG